MVVVPELGQWQFDMRMIYEEIPDIMMFRDISGKSGTIVVLLLLHYRFLRAKYLTRPSPEEGEEEGRQQEHGSIDYISQES